MYFQRILKFAVTNVTILANKYSKIKIHNTSIGQKRKRVCSLCLGGKDVTSCMKYVTLLWQICNKSKLAYFSTGPILPQIHSSNCQHHSIGLYSLYTRNTISGGGIPKQTDISNKAMKFMKVWCGRRLKMISWRKYVRLKAYLRHWAQTSKSLMWKKWNVYIKLELVYDSERS